MKMLKINKLENKNKATAFTYFRSVNIIVNMNVVLDIILGYFVGIDTVAKLRRMLMLEV